MIHEKNKSKKSRDTVPLVTSYLTSQIVYLYTNTVKYFLTYLFRYILFLLCVSFQKSYPMCSAAIRWNSVHKCTRGVKIRIRHGNPARSETNSYPRSSLFIYRTATLSELNSCRCLPFPIYLVRTINQDSFLDQVIQETAYHTNVFRHSLESCVSLV